jgi:hypothetical protein
MRPASSKTRCGNAFGVPTLVGDRAAGRRKTASIHALTLAVFLLLTGLAEAAFWRCEMPGGVFVVNLPTISSASTHEYIVDGIGRVTELTIVTTGSVVARFYYIEVLQPKSPIGLGQSVMDKAQEKAEELATRVSPEPVWKKVVKNYPTSTHAHTVEYRLESREQVTKLFDSVERAWRANAETTIKIP